MPLQSVPEHNLPRRSFIFYAFKTIDNCLLFEQVAYCFVYTALLAQAATTGLLFTGEQRDIQLSIF